MLNYNQFETEIEICGKHVTGLYEVDEDGSICELSINGINCEFLLDIDHIHEALYDNYIDQKMYRRADG